MKCMINVGLAALYLPWITVTAVRPLPARMTLAPSKASVERQCERS
jgi:hypothetical protein